MIGAAGAGRAGRLDRQLVGIDHVIIGVRDLEAARARYARLGFNSTPRGRHVGWGTANYCIMFEHDYLELLGIVDAGQFTNGLDRFLERREGLLGLVVGSRDAAATRAAWAAAGASPDEVKAAGPAAGGRRRPGRAALPQRAAAARQTRAGSACSPASI